MGDFRIPLLIRCEPRGLYGKERDEFAIDFQARP